MDRPGLFRRLLSRSIPEAAPGEGTPRRRRVERANAREGLRILVIDDSRLITTLLSRMLGQNRYEVVTAADAESGLAQVQAFKPELIFLDIVLPGMNGFAAMRELRRDPATRDIPVVMISGNAEAVEQFYAKRIGAFDLLKKPFGRQEIFARIDRMVRQGLLPGRPRREASGHDSRPAAEAG